MTTPEKDRLRLVVITRVSTNGQVDGYGLDVQEKDCRKWARANGHKIVKVCRDEGITGKAGDDERPGLAEALQMLADGEVDGILAPNLDRVARQLTQQEAILSVAWAHGGRVFTVDRGEHLADDEDDPMRTFVRQVMGAAAQLERGLIVKRLKSGRRAKAERGGYATGAPAYGQQAVERELTEHPAEADTLRQMREWADEGVGVREIARRLNAAGIPSKRGGKWHPTTVARLVDPEARAYARRQSASARTADREQARRARADRVLGRLAGGAAG
ncbi:recombinase family protein [Rhodococcus sp. NPDC047139]|uniref:recombinase family protein n=1 Tax=Rhodococcus sp. NPDC047139 TaxID=3155141 RepID=UPI00340517EC